MYISFVCNTHWIPTFFGCTQNICTCTMLAVRNRKAAAATKFSTGTSVQSKLVYEQWLHQTMSKNFWINNTSVKWKQNHNGSEGCSIMTCRPLPLIDPPPHNWAIGRPKVNYNRFSHCTSIRGGGIINNKRIHTFPVCRSPMSSGEVPRDNMSLSVRCQPVTWQMGKWSHPLLSFFIEYLFIPSTIRYGHWASKQNLVNTYWHPPTITQM